MSTPNGQGLPTALTVIPANIEGLTAVKASMLSVMCKDNHCQCLCLQETHRSQTQARPRSPGMSLVAERPHNKYGSAVFIRDDLKVKGISICEEDNVELIKIELCNAIIQSVYKPPNQPLQQGNKPHVVIGDFNSHNTLWRYSTQQEQMVKRLNNGPRGPTEGACSMAVPAMSTRLRTSAIRMPSTHPASRTSIIGSNSLGSCP